MVRAIKKGFSIVDSSYFHLHSIKYQVVVFTFVSCKWVDHKEIKKIIILIFDSAILKVNFKLHRSKNKLTAQSVCVFFFFFLIVCWLLCVDSGRQGFFLSKYKVYNSVTNNLTLLNKEKKLMCHVMTLLIILIYNNTSWRVWLREYT